MALDGLEPGTLLERSELNARFGGGIQGGMLTPAGGRLIFLFSDPARGSTYGYTADGWEDNSRQILRYTGEGSDGPQQFTRKNKALLDSPRTGREIHAFVAAGRSANSQAKVHEYLGEFILDDQRPYDIDFSHDQAGRWRSVIVFRLAPKTSTRTQVAERLGIAHMPTESSWTEIPPEIARSYEYEIPPSGAARGTRTERAFEDEFLRWLAARETSAMRILVRPLGDRQALLTDTWVPSTRELYEAKASADRNSIRMAVAQLLDYRRHILPPPARCVVLVPSRPSEDLVEYVRSTGLGLAVFDGTLKSIV